MFEPRTGCSLNTQARGRVEQLRRLGHVVDKVEFILMGGTFMSLPHEYRDYFVRGLHDALSGERRVALRCARARVCVCVGGALCVALLTAAAAAAAAAATQRASARAPEKQPPPRR